MVIEIKFGKHRFYTTREFIEHEKRIGDMVVDLFYKDGDDVHSEEEEEKID